MFVLVVVLAFTTARRGGGCRGSWSGAAAATVAVVVAARGPRHRAGRPLGGRGHLPPRRGPRAGGRQRQRAEPAGRAARRAGRQRAAAGRRRVRLEGPRRRRRSRVRGPRRTSASRRTSCSPFELLVARPGRQLLAALPDGAGAGGGAGGGGVRPAAGAGDAEHRRLLRAGRAVSTLAVLGWVGVHPIDRPEEQAIAYLEDHAEPGDTAVVVLGAANVIRDADLDGAVPLPLEPAGPGPRRRPDRARRAAPEPAPPSGWSSPTVPSMTGSSTSRRPRRARHGLRAGHQGRQVHHLPPLTGRVSTGAVLAVAAYAVPCSSWCWVIGIPNDPIGVALWLWLLAICWRLDWAWQFPRDWWPWLLALAVYGLARGLTDDLGFAPHVTWPIRVDEWLRRRRRSRPSASSTAVRRPVPERRSGALVRLRHQRRLRLALRRRPGRSPACCGCGTARCGWSGSAAT